MVKFVWSAIPDRLQYNKNVIVHFLTSGTVYSEIPISQSLVYQASQ